jgi:hypothetical protein
MLALYFFRLIFFWLLLMAFLKRSCHWCRAAQLLGGFGASTTGAATGASPDGLAAAVSIKQTTAYCLHHLLLL